MQKKNSFQIEIGKQYNVQEIGNLILWIQFDLLFIWDMYRFKQLNYFGNYLLILGIDFDSWFKRRLLDFDRFKGFFIFRRQ